MRDLAKQSFAPKTKIQISRTQLRIIIGLLIVLVVLIAAKFLFLGGSSIGGDSAVTLKDAPGGLTPVKVANTNAAAGGINLSSQTATLKIVRPGLSGSATATRTFGDGSYSLSVNATLLDPHANSYAVFLIGPEGPVFADFMSGSGTNWSLSFNDRDKYSKFNEIWITLKITKESKAPEQHIAEGSF